MLLRRLNQSSVRYLSQNAPNAVAEKATEKAAKSRQMNVYLEKRRKHDEFIAQQRSEFELGKKHLATMMGMDANSMTQNDIDKAIDYLFPSGLDNEESRPIMKPPEIVFPQKKETKFHLDGKPLHPFFFTAKPQWTQSMYELTEHLQNVLSFGDRMAGMKVPPNPEQVLDENALSTSRWMTSKELSKMLIEDISDSETEELIKAMNRLLELPFSYKAKDFIFRFRAPLSEALDVTQNIIQPEFDVEGRSSVQFMGQRKTSMAQVKVIKPGNGRFSIKHIDFMDIECDISYFDDFLMRHQIMYPLQFTRLLGLVDVECIVDAGGFSSQAGAIRYALSMALRSFVDEQTVEEMKVCGLLTQDVRVRERKKFGQEGARRKFTWKRR